MKIFIFAVALLASCLAETYYTSENDNFDIDAAAADIESLKALVNCFNDISKCDPVGDGFKQDLAEAIAEACKKCTDAQKHIFKVFLAALKEKLPAQNQAFRNKYDPGNKYFAKLEEAVSNY